MLKQWRNADLTDQGNNNVEGAIYPRNSRGNIPPSLGFPVRGTRCDISSN